MNSATLALVFGPELIRPRQVRAAVVVAVLSVWVCVVHACLSSRLEVVWWCLQVTLESHLMFGKIQKILQTLMDHYTDIFF
jgi:hypothetical protein